MFWKQGAEQLNLAKGSPQENVYERVPGGRRTHPGPDGQITWDWSEHRRKECAVYRTGKLWSSKRWLTPQKDSGAIRRHLHWGISVWSLVWEESSVWARISGIQMVLLLALVHSCQLRWPPCRGRGVYDDSNMNCYIGGKWTTCLPWWSITVWWLSCQIMYSSVSQPFLSDVLPQPCQMSSNTLSSTPPFISTI